MLARRHRLVALSAASLFLLSAGVASAVGAPHVEDSINPWESIISYDVVAQVQPNTDLLITETIVYDPGTEEVHRGILRDIPLQDALSNGDIRTYGVEIESISRDGADVTYAQSNSDSYISLQIGDPDIPIEGLHTFVISYSVTDALDVIQASDLTADSPPGISAGDIELYWDFIGSQWPFPIYRGSAAITGPTPALVSNCYAGPQGSTSQCVVQENVGPQAAVVMVADLSAGGGLTGVLGWSPTGFTEMPTPNIVADPRVAEMDRAASLLPLFLLLGAAGAIVPIVIAVMRRRTSAGVVLGATPVRYQPPQGLRPAQVQAGIDGTVDTRGYSATLLDLAARGHITVKEQAGGRFQSGGMELSWTGTGKDELADWETALLAAIFKGAPTATIGEYDEILAAATDSLTSKLAADASTSGRYNPLGDVPDRPYKLLALLGGLMLAAGLVALVFAGAFASGSGLAIIGLGLLLGGIAGAIITPRQQTKVSAAFLGEVEGFKRLLNSDSADARRDFAQKINLPPAAIFATFLPYAVVLGLEDTWMKNFPDLRPEELQNYGIYVASMYAMYGWSSSMESNFSSGMTERSSDSGFGGGGGFSGGGGGGGGGGSF